MPDTDTAAPDAQPTLAQQYELPDSTFDPELDSTEPARASKPPTPPPATPATPPTAPRNPDGTFAKRHGERTLRLARDLGIPQAEIDETPPDELRAVVNDAWIERLARRPEAASEPKAEERTVPNGTVNAPEPDGIDWGKADDGTPYTEKDFAGPIATAIKKIHEQDKLIRELQGQLGQVSGYVQQKAQEEGTSAVDAGFDSLPAGFRRIFGEGRGLDLEQSGPQFALRVQVINSLRSNPVKGVPVAKAVAQRAREMYGFLVGETATPPGKNQAAPQRQPAPVANGRYSAEDWEAATVARPTHRNGSPEPKGTKRATQAVADKLRDKNLNLDEYGDEESGLPD